MFSLIKHLQMAWLLVFLFALPVVKAQTDGPSFASMSVELWPEYDRPDVLVIYRGELSAGTPLPAQLTFQLPGHIDAMNAVAVEQNGSLFSVDPATIQLQQQGEATILTFPANARAIQLEYYDPQALSRQGNRREIDFEFTAPYAIEAVTVQVQEPLEAADFSLTPVPSRSFTDNAGLKYNTIELAGLAAGDLLTVSATYSRNTEATSAQLLNLTAEHAADIAPAPAAASAGGNQNLGYLLIGAGMAVLVIIGGYWWWTNRQLPVAPARRPPTRQPKRAPERRQKPSPKSGPPRPAAGFCHQCGTPLRSDSNFCHNCGAERRQS